MNSTRMIRTLPIMAVLIAALAASAVGCGDGGDGGGKNRKNEAGAGGGGAGGDGVGGAGGEGGDYIPPPPCEVNEDCPPEDRCDQDLGHCVPRCFRDSQCGKDTGLRCDEENGGICIPGQLCQVTANCGSAFGDDGYCDQTSQDRKCICVPDASVQAENPNLTGVCRRLSPACTECEDDIECNDDGKCVEYNFGGSKAKVCLSPVRHGTGCPGGMLPADPMIHPDLVGLCLPQFGDCKEHNPCIEDSDCPQALPICDRRRQICVAGCTFDYLENKSLACPDGRVCHATKEGTDPKLLDSCEAAHLWDVGRCGPPCESNDECRATNGDGWFCKTYGSEKRCVPVDPDNPNGCLSDDECVNPNTSVPERGFCDVTTLECRYDACRWGNDTRKGCVGPWPDCTELYKCVLDPTNPEEKFFGFCEEKDCLDKKGAISCRAGEFCALEPYRDLITGEEIDKVVEAPDGYKAGECFPADMDKWCTPCESNEDCEGLGLTDHPDLPALCMPTANGNFCAPGCAFNQECPSTWGCQAVGKLPCDDDLVSSFKFCEDDQDCGGGRCVAPMVDGKEYRFPTGMTPWKVCECDPKKADSCGDGYECNAGIGTKRDGKVVTNYCSKRGACGPQGSCEFFGDSGTDDDGVTFPLFFCGNDGGAIQGLDVSCPPTHVPGRDPSSRFTCWLSQVCTDLSSICQ